MQPLLLSQSDLSTYSPISYSFNIDQLVPHVLRAQIDLKDVLGDALFNILITEAGNKKSTPSYVIPQKYVDLLESIAPALSVRSIYYALPALWLNITQKSITKESSENSSTATKSELVYLRDDLSSSWDAYLKLLVNFITTHSADYPEYKPKVVVKEPFQMIYMDHD